MKWHIALSLTILMGVAQAQPTRVYILAGQSNMQGHGWADDRTDNGIDEDGTLRKLIQSDLGTYGHLLSNPADGNSPFLVSSNVDIYTVDQGGRTGALTTGYGVSNTQIGPEYGFGFEVGDEFASDDVFIIKTAWGGRALGDRFLSPTAAVKRDQPVGDTYLDMVSEVNAQLALLGTQGVDYELKGFGWHQGFNDRVTTGFPQEYEENMIDFINDVRAEFRAAELPFVIANTGINGAPLSGNALVLANAQLGVGNLTLQADQNLTEPELLYPEYVGNVVAINTIPFWRDASISPITNGNQGFHWNQNGETQYLIGQSMGAAMRTMSSYVQFEQAVLEVNQQTGEITINNDSDIAVPFDLQALEITSSAQGALDATNWTPITGNYDAGGDSSVDSDPWSIDQGSSAELSESTAAPGGTVAVGAAVSLGVGAWIPNPDKDLLATFTDASGVARNLFIRYTGDDHLFGDIANDGTNFGVIDIVDWTQFKSGMQLDMSGLSAAEAYRLGDLDGDFDNDIDDFGIFRNAFEQANTAPGAFAAMLAGGIQVPEPSSVAMIIAGIIAFLFGRGFVWAPISVRNRRGRQPAATVARRR